MQTGKKGLYNKTILRASAILIPVTKLYIEYDIPLPAWMEQKQTQWYSEFAATLSPYKLMAAEKVEDHESYHHCPVSLGENTPLLLNFII